MNFSKSKENKKEAIMKKGIFGRHGFARHKIFYLSLGVFLVVLTILVIINTKQRPGTEKEIEILQGTYVSGKVKSLDKIL